ncbi:uncharacterized protein LOC107639310 isoform X3 [Arachis ipaensis]|uniref:uncharacterized protein LOC107639310 isoform X3 n=1 Tax=Arachis ipaensis TaxID=130454 RepID=UPI000A2B8E57|nr:uncharacterized protein LOC107639310 isoform X3 [Arachis ipaensis]
MTSFCDLCSSDGLLRRRLLLRLLLQRHLFQRLLLQRRSPPVAFSYAGNLVNRAIELRVSLPADSRGFVLSDPKNRMFLCNFRIVISLVCGAYLVGNAFTTKEYKQVLVVQEKKGRFHGIGYWKLPSRVVDVVCSTGDFCSMVIVTWLLATGSYLLKLL